MPRPLRLKANIGDSAFYFTVVKVEPTKHSEKVTAKCVCGSLRVVQWPKICDGKYKSCGCEQKGHGHKTHGMSRNPKTRQFYKVWTGMKGRCGNENHPYYRYYGGRGIFVCDRWQKFENFRDDMMGTYMSGLSIERIDNSGPYSPDNCRWATHQEQCNNHRRNVLLTVNGLTKTATQWSHETGIPPHTIRQRVRCGWSHESAALTPVRSVRRDSST